MAEEMPDSAQHDIQHAIAHILAARELVEDLAAVVVVAGNMYAGGVLASTVPHMNQVAMILAETLEVMAADPADIEENAKQYLEFRQAETLEHGDHSHGS